MSRKTRKLMWSVPLIAAVAVIGALAAFMTVAPGSLFADGLPGTPTDLTVKPDGRTAIDLSWTAPTDGGSVDGYRIDRSTDGHTWFAHKGKTMDDLITGTSDKDMDLGPGKDYIYRVFAVNSHGVGPTSDDAGTTTKPVTAPGLVRNLQATDGRYPTKIVVTWQAPTDNGGKPITEYYVNYKGSEAGDQWPADNDADTLPGVEKVSVTTDVCDTSGGQTSNDTITWTHTPLLADVEFSYRVYASNGIVQAASDTEVGSTGNAVTPSPVTGLSVQKELVGDMVRVYWIDPASNGGQAIEPYLLHISKTNQHWPTFAATPSTSIAADLGDENTIAVTVPVPTSDDGQAYQFIHAIPSDAEGTWYYRVYTETRETPGEVTETPKRSVRAEGRVNLDAILPQAPTDPVAAAVSHTKIDLSWMVTDWDNSDGSTTIMPADDRRSPTGYRVDVSTDGVKWTKILEDNTNLALPKFSHATDVERGKLYRYRVFPIFSSRLGHAVHTGSPGVAAAAPTAPGNVRNLSATESGAGQILVTWQMPEDDGGSPITGYQAQSSGDQISWANEATRLACQLSYTDKGLAAETTLYYRVIARNSVNANAEYATGVNGAVDPGTIVSRSAKTTGADLPPAPVGLTVEAAKDSTIQSHGDRGVLVYWNAADDPDGAPIENYRVERRVKPDTASPWGEWDWVQTCLATAGTLLYTHCTDPEEPDYDGGEERMYKVAAQNAAGIGTFTDAVTTPRPAAGHTHEPMVTELTAPPDVKVSKFMDTVSVTWDRASIENAEQVKVVLFDAGVTKIVDLETFNAANDPGAATFTGVDPGTYKVTVASFRTGDRHKLSALMEVTIE